MIAAIFCVLFSAYFAISSVKPSGSSHEFVLESRINPNNAPAASLVRLPGIGPSKAAAIVAYRSDFAKQKPNRPAFSDADDLQKVRGIGPKTVKNISGWLKFDDKDKL